MSRRVSTVTSREVDRSAWLCWAVTVVEPSDRPERTKSVAGR